MTKAKLSEQAQQTVDRTKARFLLVQPDGSIRRRGEWAFNSESYVRNVAAKQPDLRVYDRQSGDFLAAIATDTAVIPEVASEPVIVAPVDPTPSGAALDASEQAAAPIEDEPRTTELSAVFDQLGIAKPVDEPLEPAPATPILDAMINVLAGGKPRGKRPSRSKKDGKPKPLSAAKGEAQRRADVKVTDKEPKARGLPSGGVTQRDGRGQ